MQRTKLGRSLFAVIMTVVMIFQMASPLMAFAAVSDKDTSTKYTDSLGDNASTEYAGRVWTDKSVFDGDVTFDTYGGGTVTVKLDGNANEDFLISYSALATAQSIFGQSKAPVDVVLILDISGSMSNGESNMDNGKSRIYNTVQAANDAIDELMTMNENNRVAVAVFSSNAQVLLPLDRYTKTTTTERRWVNGSWQYVTEDVPYFTLNRESASNSNAELTAKAIRASNSATINTTVDVEGGTNIQMGLYEGMQILANVAKSDTTVSVNGQSVQRVPSVVLLSDGSPTYSSNSSSWWAPQDNSNDGPGSAPYAGNGMKAILVGAYMKAAIDRAYGVTDTAYATTVYTVGMGITGLSDNEKNLAYMTLDPGTYWNDTAVSNSMKTAIKDYWSRYTAGNNTGTLNINVGQMVQSGRNWVYADKNYALTHPTTGYDVDPTSGYDYVDDYYGADNASALTEVFQQIVANISISAPQVPTEIKGDDPLTDGYITYTDPIGQYMEVKDVKSVIYAGTEFTQKAEATSGNTTTYTFAGEVHSPVYGDQNIQNILISVTKDASGNETMTVKIPASVIPLRVNEVTLNADGSVKSHTNNGAFPTRVVYSVGLQDGIKKVADDGDEYVDTSKLSQAYIQANTNADGFINFYSNVYTGTNAVNGSTAGNATVEFEPAHNNPFYYIQEDMPIYVDAEFKNQVRAEDGLDDDTVYYYEDVYYHGTTVESAAIARTGTQLKRTSIKTGTDGYLYREAGSPRLNRILEFEGTKIENATGTAEDFYAPIFVHADGNPDPYEGKFVIYHGNNGLLSLAASGNLDISKDVATAAGLTAPNETFVFTLNLDGTDINGGAFTYVIRDAEQNQVSTGTVSKNSPTISLQDGQTATVYGLPPATTYSVTEAAVAGFASDATGATGIIHPGQTQHAVFTNTYSVTPVVSDSIVATKILEGRTWDSGDVFKFFMTPYNNGPLPAGYNAETGITITAQDATGKTASFELGAIEFTEPGTFRYTLWEDEPENDAYLPGMSYSRALYRLVYVVVDNGDGTLSIDQNKSGIQRLYDDNANQLFSYDSNNQIVMNAGEEAEDEIVFINTYSADAVVRVPTALKAYSDPSGTMPLVSGMFQFKLEALGYYVNDDISTMQQDINIPMPDGAQNGVAITTNEGHNVTFPAVNFTQDLLTDKGVAFITYCYRMSEIVPADADKVPGMTYDTKTYDINVEVWIDATKHALEVNAVYPNQERIATFTNSYALTPATGSVSGTKTLIGRDMLSGETFQFSLVGANAATNLAVRDGSVVVPSSIATVSGGKDGVAESFSFDGIRFTKPGTYTFLVSETKGSAPAVHYDESNIAVTFVVEDTNGDAVLEVTSVTYSNGENSADFVNTYTYAFNDTPVSLKGTKNLTGKSLVEGEFYFRVEAYHNDSLINDYLVSHAADDTADNDTYSGEIVFLSGATYNEAGTYTYYISEQIPEDEHKVGGTTYDPAKYRYTVVVTDDMEGNLKVTSKTLEKANGSAWQSAESIVFNNTYTPTPTAAPLPLIKKVITGDRKDPLQAGEFSFQLSLVSADPVDGIVLPATTVVKNAANGDLVFDDIIFTKAGTYVVSVTEIVPDDANKVPGITYSTQEILATFRVVDNRNGTLTATLTHFDGGDTFINSYEAKPATYTPVAKKLYEGDSMRIFDFELSGEGFQSQTKQNDTYGNIQFDTLTFTQKGTYTFTIQEKENVLWGFIKWDANVYTLQVNVADDGLGQLVIESVAITSQTGRDDLVFRNVHEDLITKKEVELEAVPGVKIDNKKVEIGDVLVYTISYTNYTGKTADVTITDTIPQYTSYVEGSAGDGVYTDGKLTWSLTNIPANATATVSFKVQVTEAGGTVENQAEVVEGNNVYRTNETTNPVVEDAVGKTVSLAEKPDISIDGEKVNVGDILQYTITYHNADDAAAVVEITDTIPAHTSFVDGSAGSGVYAGGKLTWTLDLGIGETGSVSFQVKVNDPDVFIDNQAVAIEGVNEYRTNVVTNHTYEEVGGKDVALAEKPEISIDGKMVQVGDELIYTIDYTNTTTSKVDVVITDTIPAHTELLSVQNGGVAEDGVITWNLQGVEPKQTVTVSFRVAVQDPGVVIENQAQIFDGTNKLTNKVTNAIPEKTVDKQNASVGDVLTYTIVYTNTTGAAADVVITDTLDSKLSYIDGTAGDGVYENGTITWTLSDVPAGKTVTVSFQAKVALDAQAIENTAQIIENQDNIVTTNKTVTQILEPELTIEKKQAVGNEKATDKELKVAAGDTVTYSITVTNTGEGDAFGITVTDKIPEGLRYITESANAGGVVENGTVTWSIDTLAAGESVVLTFKVAVPTVNESTTWTNIAEVVYENDPDDSDPIESNRVKIEQTVLQTPKTGDTFHLVMFLTLLVLSGFGITAVMICKKRDERKEASGE